MTHQQELPQRRFTLVLIEPPDDGEERIGIQHSPWICLSYSVEVLDGPCIDVFQEDVTSDRGVCLQDSFASLALMIANEAVCETSDIKTCGHTAVPSHWVTRVARIGCKQDPAHLE